MAMNPHDMPNDTHEIVSLLEHQAGKTRYHKKILPVIYQNLAPLLAVLLLLSNGFWWTRLSSLDQSLCVRPQLIYSPATTQISYEKRTLWRSIRQDNPYTGDPRPELDSAWRELIKPFTIRISSQELAYMSESSIRLPDGSGYLAEMAVFHELHCIKRIRRHLHMNYYYGNLTQEEDFMDRERKHIDHCLEYWREAAICRGDPTLATFDWYEGELFSKQQSTHECVNWESLRHWAESRMVDTSHFW